MTSKLKNMRLINGPVNVIRMQGNIGNVKKTVYLFMDYHTKVEDQTECNGLFTTDVHKYFVEMMERLNEKNKKYDFFVEIHPYELKKKKHKQSQSGIIIKNKNNYIEQVVQLFQLIFKYNESENKVNTNDFFKNVRLHYLDIRSFFERDEELQNLLLYNKIAWK